MVKWPGEGWGHKEGLREKDCFLCFIFFFSCQELVPKDTQRYSYMTASTYFRKGGFRQAENCFLEKFSSKKNFNLILKKMYPFFSRILL